VSKGFEVLILGHYLNVNQQDFVDNLFRFRELKGSSFQGKRPKVERKRS